MLPAAPEEKTTIGTFLSLLGANGFDCGIGHGRTCKAPLPVLSNGKRGASCPNSQRVKEREAWVHLDTALEGMDGREWNWHLEDARTRRLEACAT